jgi:hypothetical protein
MQRQRDDVELQRNRWFAESFSKQVKPKDPSRDTIDERFDSVVDRRSLPSSR